MIIIIIIITIIIIIIIEKEKIENYQALKRELKRIWKLRRVTLVPIIIGALGTVSKDIEKWLGVTGVTCRLESL